MALTQFIYDPFTEFDRLFDDAFSSRFRPDRPDSDESRPTTIRPKMDLIAKPDNQVVARFELPGMNQQNVKVEVHNDRLTISGEKKSEAGEGQFAVRERSYGSFARTLQLPEGTKPEQVQARMQDGILEVTFPKAPPEQETKAITIEVPESTKQTGTKK